MLEDVRFYFHPVMNIRAACQKGQTDLQPGFKFNVGWLASSEDQQIVVWLAVAEKKKQFVFVLWFHGLNFGVLHSPEVQDIERHCGPVRHWVAALLRRLESI